MNRLAVSIIIASVFGLPAVAGAEDFLDKIERGNQAYHQGQYDQALENYGLAEPELPESPELEFNIGTTMYQQGRYEEAVERFTKALNSTDVNVEQAAHYNLGNTHFKAQDYPKAIDSYQKALELNPDDMDAKYNLELARKMLKENMKPDQENQQQQQQQRQNQQQKDQQNQDQQDQQEQSEDQQKQEQDQQQDQQQDQNQQQQMQKPKPISKEDAERILNALRDDEQEIQKQIRRDKGQSEYNGKDW
jgi:tetratricopeptide (TPR) repeat protein